MIKRTVAVVLLALALPPLLGAACMPTMPSKADAMAVVQAACENDPDVRKMAAQAGVTPAALCAILIKSFTAPKAAPTGSQAPPTG
jgi:hypothetical protein